MIQFCPITSNNINENGARINAFFSLIILLAYVLTSSIWLIVFLGIDFIIRGFFDSKYSLLANIGKIIIEKFHLPTKMVNAGPKIFAARLGATFSVAVIVLYFLQFSNASLALSAFFGIFCFLESAFAICVACIVYPFVARFLQQA